MNSKRNLSVILLIGVVLFAPMVAQSTQYAGRDILTGTWQGESVEYVDGEILFMIQNPQNSAQAKHYLTKNDLSLARDLDRFGFGKVNVPPGENIFPVIERMQKTGFFLYVEPNLIDWLSLHPDDPFYLTNQWGLHNTGQSGGTADADIDAPEAWDLETGSTDVIVSVLDSGIPIESDTLSHEDLDDGTKIILGQDFAGDGEGVKDENGHGTHVAGIISAETNNSTGVAGVCWNCRIMVNQVFDSNGGGSHEAFRDGMIYSVDNGATLVNYSGGGSHSATKEHGVAYADSHDVLLVAAAGNRSGGSVIYPGAYSSTYQNVVCVSSSDHNDSVSSFSSVGDEVCVAAPGGSGSPYDADDIYSTMPNYWVTLNGHGISQDYGYCAGTSMASPMVAGVAALMLSVNPSLSPSEVREVLEETAEQVGGYDYDPQTGKCRELGHGRINAHDAVLASAGPAGEADPPGCFPVLKVTPGETRTITFKLFSVGGLDLIYSVYSDHPCIHANVGPSVLPPGDSVVISVILDGTGACEGIFIAGNVILSTNEGGGTTENIAVHAVVAEDFYECPADSETWDSLENGVLALYANANCEKRIYDIGSYPDTVLKVFYEGGTVVATTSGGDTLAGRFMRRDWRAGARDKLYTEQCEPDWEPPFWILYTKNIFIEATHLPPPAHQKWWWWEVSKQIKFFKPIAPEIYKHLVITYLKVKRHDPPDWWPDLSPFTGYEDTYVGVAHDIDCPSDTFDYHPYDTTSGSKSHSAEKKPYNWAGYDAVNQIAWQRGWDYTDINPLYNEYYCGIALAYGGESGESIVPYGSYCIKNNQYLYPQDGWGWKDEELCELAATPGNHIQDSDSVVDRSYVFTARMINAGNNPEAEASFTVVEVVDPYGLPQLQVYVDSARAIVERERAEGGFPVRCGDVNGDFIVNVGDVVYLISYLYKSGPAPYCPADRGDINRDGIINVGDVVYMITFLYKGGSEPDCPGIWY